MAKKLDAQAKALKLRMQLEGKQVTFNQPKKINQPQTDLDKGTFNFPTDIKPQMSTNLSHPQDTIYLKKDLRKIGLLSIIALSVQLLLLLAQRNGLILRGS